MKTHILFLRAVALVTCVAFLNLSLQSVHAYTSADLNEWAAREVIAELFLTLTLDDGVGPSEGTYNWQGTSGANGWSVSLAPTLYAGQTLSFSASGAYNPVDSSMAWSGGGLINAGPIICSGSAVYGLADGTANWNATDEVQDEWILAAIVAAISIAAGLYSLYTNYQTNKARKTTPPPPTQIITPPVTTTPPPQQPTKTKVSVQPGPTNKVDIVIENNGTGQQTIDIKVSPIPEPSSLALVVLGMLVLGRRLRRSGPLRA